MAMSRKNVSPHINRGEKMADPIIGRAWHPDGTPFKDADYRNAGLYVPTNEQLAAWAKEDLER